MSKNIVIRFILIIVGVIAGAGILFVVIRNRPPQKAPEAVQTPAR